MPLISLHIIDVYALYTMLNLQWLMVSIEQCFLQTLYYTKEYLKLLISFSIVIYALSLHTNRLVNLET